MGLLGAALLLPFLWGADSQARWGLACVAGAVGFPTGIALVSVAGRGPVVGVVVGVAACLFLVERSLRIRVSGAGIERLRGFPYPRSHFIPWAGVEAVRADLRIITMNEEVFGFVISTSTERENLLIIEGDGQRIVLNTTRYPGGNQLVDTILERCRPSAVRWTLAGTHEPEGADLGGVRLYRDRIAWSRAAVVGMSLTFHLLLCVPTLGLWPVGYGLWLLARRLRGFEEAPLAKVRLRSDGGVLWIDSGDRVCGLRLARVRNGLFLPEVVSRLRPASVSPAEVP